MEILGSVLNKEPDVSAAPPRARKLLRWCLEKDRKLRLQAIGDARRMLEEEPESAPLRPVFGIGWRGLAGWGAAAVTLPALGALAYVHFREKPPVKELVRFEVAAPAGATFGNGSLPASPDGGRIALVAKDTDHKSTIWLRSLDTEEIRPLAGTEGVIDDPIWSPDSRFLAFATRDGKLKRIAATGGLAQMLCDDPSPAGGAWTSDNRILLGSTSGPLQLVSAAGGLPTPLTALDRSRNERGHFTPALLPDGHHFLYWRGSTNIKNGGVYVGSLDAAPDRQSTWELLPDATPAMYVPSPLAGDERGFLLFWRGMTFSDDFRATLTAQPFDP